MAHEINNPLVAIVGYSELLADDEPPDDAAELARRVLQQAHRCARVVQSVLTFARASQSLRIRGSVNDVLTEAIALLESERPAGAEVRLNLDPDLPCLMGDPEGLRQAFGNIIANAYQSLAEQPGAVTVATRRAGGNIEVEISDTGRGIAEEALGKLFDPFFTTKEVGKGTGLGLSVAHGVVQAHGGRIEAANRPDGGARFTVVLPIAADEHAGSDRRESQSESLCPG